MQRYRGRISGPLLDRIDLHVEVPALRYAELAAVPPAEGVADLAGEAQVRSVHVAEAIQYRERGSGGVV